MKMIKKKNIYKYCLLLIGLLLFTGCRKKEPDSFITDLTVNYRVKVICLCLAGK